MNPKEKAEALTLKFINLFHLDLENFITRSEAIECAKLVCDIVMEDKTMFTQHDLYKIIKQELISLEQNNSKKDKYYWMCVQWSNNPSEINYQEHLSTKHPFERMVELRKLFSATVVPISWKEITKEEFELFKKLNS